MLDPTNMATLAELRKQTALLTEIRDRLPKPQTSMPVVGAPTTTPDEPNT